MRTTQKTSWKGLSLGQHKNEMIWRVPIKDGGPVSVAQEPVIIGQTIAATTRPAVAICGALTAGASVWDSSSSGENKKFSPTPIKKIQKKNVICRGINTGDLVCSSIHHPVALSPTMSIQSLVVQLFYFNLCFI